MHKLKDVKRSIRSWARNNEDAKATAVGLALAQAADLLPPKHPVRAA